jgi:hypothetical protein
MSAANINAPELFQRMNQEETEQTFHMSLRHTRDALDAIEQHVENTEWSQALACIALVNLKVGTCMVQIDAMRRQSPPLPQPPTKGEESHE